MLVEPVSAARLLQEEPSVETSTLYPVIAEPPSLDGAVQDRSICVWPLAVALSPVGAPGTPTAAVVALATLDAGLAPLELMADTR